MKKVLVRAPLLSQSGYGVHSRQIFRFCESQKDWSLSTQILPWGITPWNINPDAEDGIYGRAMSLSVPASEKYDVSIQIQLPHEWDNSLAKFNVGITAGVETNKCSAEWVDTHINKMDLVIVPSKFTKKTLENSATVKLTTPIVVLPEAYFDELLEEPTADPLENLSTNKNFLMVGTLTSDDSAADRKNLAASIVWFLRAFEGKRDVGLVVKTSRGRDTTIDRDLVRKMMQQVKKSSGVDEKRCPKIYMLHGSMTREEMRNLYKSKKICAYASATRGEGFGLPLLEAAVSALPIVATAWSAHTEFLEGESFLAAKYDIKPIAQSRIDGRIFVKESCWANPREGNFSRKMKLAVSENKKLRKVAKSLSSSLQKTHSMSSLQDKFNEIVKEYIQK